jgi:hypothetical protein
MHWPACDRQVRSRRAPRIGSRQNDQPGPRAVVCWTSQQPQGRSRQSCGLRLPAEGGCSRDRKSCLARSVEDFSGTAVLTAATTNKGTIDKDSHPEPAPGWALALRILTIPLVIGDRKRTRNCDSATLLGARSYRAIFSKSLILWELDLDVLQGDHKYQRHASRTIMSIVTRAGRLPWL